MMPALCFPLVQILDFCLSQLISIAVVEKSPFLYGKIDFQTVK